MSVHHTPRLTEVAVPLGLRIALSDPLNLVAVLEFCDVTVVCVVVDINDVTSAVDDLVEDVWRAAINRVAQSEGRK